jgi:hypothetical protein
MQCREVRELLDAFLGDQLLVETTNDLVRHLEGCPACRTELEGRRALRARLQSAFAGAVPLAPTPEFLNGLEARLRAHQTSRMTRRSWLRSWGAAAAAMITVISGGLFARGALHRSRLAALARNAAGDHQNCAIKFNLSERPISLEEGRAPLRSSVRIVHDLAGPDGFAEWRRGNPRAPFVCLRGSPLRSCGVPVQRTHRIAARDGGI